MRTLLNILWNVPGLGFVAAFCWVLAGVVMATTIVGLPWAKACFTLANYTLAPFGRELASRRDVTRRESLGTGGLGLLANVVWFLLAGWWLIVLHIVAAGVSAITIIGIPFAWAHLKIAAAAIAPVGKVVVPSEVAVEIDREKAAAWLYGARRR
jgi:uncharacterized membrane protein YccF (DUF307 family)